MINGENSQASFTPYQSLKLSTSKKKFKQYITFSNEPSVLKGKNCCESSTQKKNCLRKNVHTLLQPCNHEEITLLVEQSLDIVERKKVVQ